MKTPLIILSSLSLLITSCGNEQSQQLSGIEQEVLEATEAAGLKAEDFIGKIDELLTLEMAAEVAGLPANSAEKDYSKISSLESLKYEWESDRVKKVSINGQSLNVPLANSIELSWVKNTTLTQFKHDYHNPTPEEIKNAKAAMDKKSAELAAEGKASREQTELANKIAQGSISKLKVEEVPNLGEYAVFVNTELMGASARDLKVFYKGLSFTLNVDLKDDPAYNDQKAIETARKIIQEKL